MKGRIIEDIRTLFKQKGKYHYKLVRVENFCSNNCIKFEIMVIKIETQQSKNILIKLTVLKRYYK